MPGAEMRRPYIATALMCAVGSAALTGVLCVISLRDGVSGGG